MFMIWHDRMRENKVHELEDDVAVSTQMLKQLQVRHAQLQDIRMMKEFMT